MGSNLLKWGIMKSFVYLYPIPEYLDFEIEKGYLSGNGESKSEFRERYKGTLNTCIDERYRQQGFSINYVLFDESPVSDLVVLQPADRLINVGFSLKTLQTKYANGKSLNPNDRILDQLGSVEMLRIGGFHIWDCVDKLARGAYERGINTLVDEDLTEFLTTHINEGGFRTDKFPNCNPEKLRKFGKDVLQMFIQVRRERPWMWQYHEESEILGI